MGGCPIPIIYCYKCVVVPVEKSELPIKLPEDVNFNKNSGNLLKNHRTWKHTKCYKCHGYARRETDTFDTFVESSWYFIKFCSLNNGGGDTSSIIEKWLPVDQYIGGIEHAILHLLYARFF